MSRPIETRPGDWICDSCGQHNFASRFECFRCRKPKPGGFGAPYQPRYPPQPNYGVRQGDWYCSKCGYLNFASRTECKQCGAAIQPNQHRESGYSKGFGAPVQMREGDWLCPNCQYHNFASRDRCNQCGQYRP